MKEKLMVSNCHKQPSNFFTEFSLELDEVKKYIIKITETLQKFNNRSKIIFTVSTVRYLKNGLEENSISKASLILSINSLKEKLKIDYFPAFEILIDDLRDYRIYSEDMKHPNEIATEYIWQKFTECYIKETEHAKMKEMLKFYKLSQHK